MDSYRRALKIIRMTPRRKPRHRDTTKAELVPGVPGPISALAGATRMWLRRPMSREYLDLLFPGEPFFEGRTCGIQTPAKQGVLLTALVSLVARPPDPVRILEVGAWLGFSALTWAHAVHRFGGGEVLCVDAWEPYFPPGDLGRQDAVYRDMDAVLRSGLAYDLFIHNAACAPPNAPIRYARGRSADILPTLDARSFDLIYIDGSHYYDDVKADLVAAIPLLREGGILAGDDLELQLGDIDREFARQHVASDYVADSAGRPFHPGVTLAVGEVIGPVASFGRAWFVRKRGSGFEAVDPNRGTAIIPPHWPAEMQQEARALLTPRKGVTAP